MPKSTVYDWDTTAANNLDVGGANIAEGCLPAGINNAIRNEMAQVADWRDQLTYRDAGGSPNALTLTPAVALTAYASRLVVTFRATETNTDVATLNVSAVGAKAVRKIIGGADIALSAGDIQDNGRYVCVYDSTADAGGGAFILTNPSSGVGTFTPTIDGTSVAGSGTYTTQIGRYTRNGRLIFFEINLTWTAHTGTGNIIVSGLPFTSSGAGFSGAVVIVASNLTFDGHLAAVIPNNSSQVQIRSVATGAALGDVAMDTLGTINLSGWYTI